jgi:hypothetical protein
MRRADKMGEAGDLHTATSNHEETTMATTNPQRPALDYAKSVHRSLQAFQEFRVALMEARAAAGEEPGCNWEVGELSHRGQSFTVDYAGIPFRYRFKFDPKSSNAQAVLEVMDHFDEDIAVQVAAETFTARGETDLRYHDDGDELFINRPAGAREMFLIQVGKHLNLL